MIPFSALNLRLRFSKTCTPVPIVLKYRDCNPAVTVALRPARTDVISTTPKNTKAPENRGFERLGETGAGEAIRTPDPNLGKVVLYP
ncbi:conserved hypothetical protein [Sinorhizobium medicae]|uniref:Uncharacterized protein n=1 Tax=Sinorhizobium medicae TaxID=110321 RepID=A0A508WXY7_9HYPH|nr:conserved hypothetical protein [Sinorhizobium medicae]